MEEEKHYFIQQSGPCISLRLLLRFPKLCIFFVKWNLLFQFILSKKLMFIHYIHYFFYLLRYWCNGDVYVTVVNEEDRFNHSDFGLLSSASAPKTLANLSQAWFLSRHICPLRGDSLWLKPVRRILNSVLSSAPCLNSSFLLVIHRRHDLRSFPTHPPTVFINLREKNG